MKRALNNIFIINQIIIGGKLYQTIKIQLIN